MTRTPELPTPTMPDAPPTLGRGWYPDPEDPSRSRYWNGKSWTERTTHNHPTARRVIGGLMCLYGIPLLWERGGVPGGTVLLFTGLLLFVSSFSGPTQRPLRWVLACLELLVGGASVLVAAIGLAAVILDGDAMGLFVVLAVAPVASASFYLGLMAILDLRASAAARVGPAEV